MKRLLPTAVFLIVALLGAGITWVVYQAIHDTAKAEFKSLAGEAVNRVTSRIDQHLSLLTATHSLFTAGGGQIGAGPFRTFITELDIEGQYDGIQGIGFAQMIRTGEEALAEARLRREYDLERAVWPETDQPYRTPIVLLEPHDSRNDKALGFDMFSEEKRRRAMQVAMRSQETTASPPVALVQEITAVKQMGFLVYRPFYADESRTSGTPDGFVYAPFRAGDLHAAALEEPPVLPVVLKTYDVTDDEPVLLYESPGFDQLQAPDAMTDTIEADIAGRIWRFEVASTGSAAAYAEFLPVYALCAVLIVLAGSLAAGARWQHRAVEAAVALHEASRQSLSEKELLVQEMRHRIKNSISRMMAIARQTAATSETLEDFTKSFSSRMNAMAKAQDLLARSHWGRADLGDLLKTELGQVFGDHLDESQVDGPPIDLNERATQALGLVFHELATNALKYGGVADDTTELTVRWRFEGKRDKRKLKLVWAEKGNVVEKQPESKGFGTRLVDASVRGELNGEIDRSFDANGMTVTFTIPAKSIG